MLRYLYYNYEVYNQSTIESIQKWVQLHHLTRKDYTMSYIYETHLHTCFASLCGKSKGSEYISFYKELGYAGIIVTDHFFNGNCRVPKDLPWQERIEQYCEGYEDAKAEGDIQGLQVFFAWEFNFDGDEYLVYGLDKEWLLNHPDMLSWNHIKHFEEVDKAGGLVVQAHPFRERIYLSTLNLHPHQCHAWEVANAGNPSMQDKLAYRYAKEHNIPMTAGSDIHVVSDPDSYDIFGVAFDTPLTSMQDYVKRIKAGEGKLHVPESRLIWTPNSEVHLPIRYFDEKNQLFNYEKFEMIP